MDFVCGILDRRRPLLWSAPGGLAIGRHMKPGFSLLCAIALGILTAAPGSAAAVDLVYKKTVGAVQSSCVRDEKTKHLICVVVYSKPPYLGFQLGSEEDPESVAVTAGARRVPNSELRIKVDDYAAHHVFGEGFTGQEAEALRGEIEQGTKADIVYEMEGKKDPVTGSVDLADFKTALRDVESLRVLDKGD